MGIDESIYDNVVGEAILEIRKELVYPCELDCKDILKCLYCDNCYFKITYPNDDGITTYHDLNTINKSSNDNDHLILFYDIVPESSDLYSYIFDENSSYRIIRLGDSEIIVDHIVKHPIKQLIR